jgi:GntR family transcriptional regulator
MTKGSPVPLYHRISSMLASRIHTAVYPPNSLLGTEVELAKAFGVSRITIRRALDILEDEGLIERHRSRGTFVAADVRPQAAMELNGNLDDILLQTTTAGTISSLKRKVVASEDVAKALHVAPGTRVYRFERLRASFDDVPVPVSLVVNYLPLDVGENISRTDLMAEAMTNLLDSRPDTRLGWGQQFIHAALADAEIAKPLQVDVGSPILYIERTLYAPDGRPLDLARISYRGDKYSYSVRLDRVANVPGRRLAAPDQLQQARPDQLQQAKKAKG